MPPVLGAVIGGVSGIAKGIGGAQREAKERQLAADTQRYSPWTGLQAGNITKSNVAGDVLGGATGGMAAAQSFQKPEVDKFDTKTGNPFFDPQTGKPYGAAQ